MARITEAQQSVIDSFKVIRAKDLEDKTILDRVKGPVKDGNEQRKIIELFIESLEEDQEGSLASFVVMTKDGMPLLLFSLRCGELFQKNDEEYWELIRLGHEAYLAVIERRNNPTLPLLQRQEKIKCIEQALNKGLTYEGFENCHRMWQSKADDVALEINSDLTRVLESYPAIELKLFAANVSARDYWNTLPMPKDKRMGEVLFWTKVVDKIESILANVGCQYLYLFAADEGAEGTLVQYYRHILNFGSDKDISANKPFFDYTCLFLFQSMKELKHKKAVFCNAFNPDADETGRGY